MAQQEQKKRSRRAHLNDFQPDLRGDYVYTGAHFTFEGGAEALRRFRLRAALLAGLAAAAAVGAGCLPAVGLSGRGSHFAAILPYLGLLAAVFGVTWKTVRLLNGVDPLRAYVYEATVPKLPVWTGAGALFGALSALAALLLLLLRPEEGKILPSVLYILLTAASAALNLLLRREIRASVWGQSNKNQLPEGP